MTGSDQWWVVRLGNLLIWSRLRLRASGTAEVLDSVGNTLSYDSEDSARAALLDAGFLALDGMDHDDAAALGLGLEQLVPPEGDDEALRTRMVQPFPARH
ncbi:MAG TPA: hypothetical protein PLI44_02630 [Chiayiivirga sp.]|jgi:hypothetical protein|uniref:Uncharacterized protein n=1 Tax=Denitratimonas tolerans TaxID=1338420 RepID=A0AAW9R6E9_9GAMM|nr:hypothetical protein [Chiayiivirga sp.]MEB2314901.1 hypothetical protein [Xanthomonadaceae bacterium]HMN34522.1 hypothetical protein [Chiayiivirga sp.]HRN59128.1 hypothetical protein [Chiayiivirga sp.]HRO88308.1 hypothetical protein [Chiayiivirga sp.]